MKIIFVSGPYRGDVAKNIEAAQKASIQLWNIPGVGVFTPRCDAMLMLSGWDKSEGASSERAEAVRRSLPIFDSVEQVKDWVKAA